MRLTVHSDYALRMLIYLGLRPEELCTIQEIADAYGISKNHLMKVAYRLGQAGYVDAVRGRNGGLRLGRAAADIRIGDVVRGTEDHFILVECFAPESDRCAISGCCLLRQILSEALEAYLAVLDSHSLADLIAARVPLLERLGIPEGAGT